MQKIKEDFFTYILIVLGVSLAFYAMLYSKSIFFDDYEAFSNYAIIKASSTKASIIKASSDNFLLYPLFSIIQHPFQNLSVYGGIKLILLILSLSTIAWSCFQFFTISRKAKWLLTFVILLLLLENIYLIGNMRLGGVLSFAMFLYLLVTKNKPKIYLILFYLLLLFNISNRIHLSLIFTFLFLLVSFLLSEKYLVKHFFIGFLISLSSLSLFYYLSLKDLDHIKEYFQYERQIFDMQNFSVEKGPLHDSLTDEELTFYAKALFLDDKPVKEIAIQDILKHKTLSDYFLKNSKIKQILMNKFNAVFEILLKNYPILLIMNLVLWLFLFFKSKDFLQKLKVIILLLSFMSVLMFLFLFAELYEGLLFNFLCFLFLVGLIFLIKFHTKKLALTLLVLSIPLLFHFFFYSYSHIKTLKEKEAIHVLWAKQFELDIANQKQPTIAYLIYNDVLPTQLMAFNTHLFKQLSFLDYGPLNTLPFFESRKEIDFPNTNGDLLAKYEWLIEKNQGEIYSNEFIMKFIEKYFSQIHHKKLTFESVYSIPNSDLVKYKITIE